MSTISTFDTALALLTSAISSNASGDDSAMYLEMTLLLESATDDDLLVLIGTVLALAAGALVTQVPEPHNYFRILAQAAALDEGSNRMS